MGKVRIRAVEGAQVGENREIVFKMLRFPHACIYNRLAGCPSGGRHTLRKTHRFDRSKKISDVRISWIIQTVSDKDLGQLQFLFTFANSVYGRRCYQTQIWN
jgi:hypothetical protein